MKSNRFLNFITILAVVSSFTACKKYGVAVDDGYDDASKNEKSITVDTNMSFIDRSAYSKARVFPGLVDQTEPRVTNQKFTLDLNFSTQTTANLRISVAPSPQFSTGYYAAPGELIKLIVPAGINGLSIQVGGQTDNLTGKVPLLRDPIIIHRQQLFPGVNYVRNIYGGTIYINASFAFTSPVEFTITGAVASPDFILGVDNHADWKARVLASKVPWLELRSKRVIFLVPRDKIVSQFTNPTEPLVNMAEPLALWNTVFEQDFNGWMGLSDNATDPRDRSPQGAWRGVLDIQLSAGYGHSGFPFVGQNDSEWFGSFTSATRLKTSNGTWGSYHEFGHNAQQGSVWSWSTLGETTNNLFSFKVANRIGADYNILHPAVRSGFPVAIQWASTPGTKDFDGSDASINDPFRRMTPFVQIFELYGYGAMTKLYTEARHAQRLSNNDVDEHDFVYEKLSAFTGTDLAPFFDAWGILISPQSQTKISALYPLLTKQIWTYNPLNKTGGTAPIVYNTTYAATGTVYGTSTFALAVDGITTTHWDATAGMPYTISADAGVSRLMKAMTFQQRSDNVANPANSNKQSNIKNVDISYSLNGTTWVVIGSYQVPNNNGVVNTYTFATPVKARYFRAVVTSNWGNLAGNTVGAALAEFSLIPN